MFTVVREEHRHRPGARGCPPEEKSPAGFSAILWPARGKSEQVGECSHQWGGTGQYQCRGEKTGGQSQEYSVPASAPATSFAGGGHPSTHHREREHFTKVTDDVS